MRLRGIHYDAGIDALAGGLTRPALSPAEVAADLDLIAYDLHANAVRITCRDAGRLEMAGRLAAERGLAVWLSPMLVNGTAPATLALIADAADAAEALRLEGHTVVLVIGCELSVFLAGTLPGNDVRERVALLTDPARLMPAIMASGIDPQERVGAFLAEAVRVSRERFAGPLTYASGSWEEVPWGAFDIVGVDAYRSAANRETFVEDLQAYTRHDRPVVVTESGCATFQGARDLGSLAWTVVDQAVPGGRMPPGITRDEEGQAAEIVSLLQAFEAAGVEGAFVYTLVAPTYGTNGMDPLLDLDAASYALLRSWPDGRTSRKPSFSAVAAHFASRGADPAGG